MVKASVWVIVLNWNNGSDTVECLDSVLGAQDPAIAGVVICDNASTDDSVETIRVWARRRSVNWLERPALPPGRDDLPVLDPLRCLAERQGSEPLMFIFLNTGANLGFAGGNNVGIDFVRRFANYESILILNNDTLLTPGCVSAMAARLAANPGLGMCGATVVYDWDRRVVQAYAGARFERWLGRAKLLGAHAPVHEPRDEVAVEAKLDYILGAALLISRPCLEAVGPMYDGYFLYYEEIDWAVRAKRRGYRLGYASQAVIYHKEGRTIGSSTDRSKRSLLSDYYLARSRLRFTARCYPWFLPTVALFGLAQCLRSVLGRDLSRARVQLRAMLGLRLKS